EVVLTPPATTPDSFLNDLAVDRTTDTVYVADSAGAVIVVDIASGSARRVLDGHVSTVPEDVDLVVAGRVLELGGAPARVGINPITLDAGG
ncbi:MAG: L-dopachrome tautomerase-related protein, partial [Planctomycetota bacterium]